MWKTLVLLLLNLILQACDPVTVEEQNEDTFGGYNPDYNEVNIYFPENYNLNTTLPLGLELSGNMISGYVYNGSELTLEFTPDNTNCYDNIYFVKPFVTNRVTKTLESDPKDITVTLSSTDDPNVTYYRYNSDSTSYEPIVSQTQVVDCGEDTIFKAEKTGTSAIYATASPTTSTAIGLTFNHWITFSLDSFSPNTLTRDIFVSDETFVTFSNNGDNVYCSNNNGVSFGSCSTGTTFLWRGENFNTAHQIKITKANSDDYIYSYTPAGLYTTDFTNIDTYDCDVTVSANEDFDAFEARLTNPDTSSAYVICIDDGITISTTGAGDGDRIEFSNDNVVVIARSGDTATIDNSYAGATATQAGAFYINGENKITIAGLTFDTDQNNGSAIQVIDSDELIVKYNTIDTTGAQNAYGIFLNGSNVNDPIIQGNTITTTGNTDSHAALFYQTQDGTFTNNTFEVSGTSSSAAVFEEVDGTAVIDNNTFESSGATDDYVVHFRTDSAGDGDHRSFTATLEGNTFDITNDENQAGIFVQNVDTIDPDIYTLTFTDNIFVDRSGGGVFLINDEQSITFSENKFIRANTGTGALDMLQFSCTPDVSCDTDKFYFAGADLNSICLENTAGQVWTEVVDTANAGTGVYGSFTAIGQGLSGNNSADIASCSSQSIVVP